MADDEDDEDALDDVIHVRLSKAAKVRVGELGQKAGMLKASTMARVLLYKAIGFTRTPGRRS